MPAPLTIFIDGDCPLCRREANLLLRLDRGRGGLLLQDIAAPGFDASHYGLTRDALMGTIHGLRNGEPITGMEVFRCAYAAVGWGWLLAWTAWPIFRPITDAAYRFFARHRLRLTGRCDSGACRPGAAGPRA